MTKAEKTRQFIIETSAPIFNKKGVAGTTLSDVMKATQMSKGILYLHFEDKEDLSKCVVTYNLKQHLARTSDAIQHFETAKDTFFALVDFLSRPFSTPVEGGCPMLNFGMEADDTNDAICQLVGSAVSEALEGITKILEWGVENGEFKTGWDYKTFAIKAYAVLEGGLLISRTTKDVSKINLLAGLLKKEVDENMA